MVRFPLLVTTARSGAPHVDHLSHWWVLHVSLLLRDMETEELPHGRRAEGGRTPQPTFSAYPLGWMDAQAGSIGKNKLAVADEYADIRIIRNQQVPVQVGIVDERGKVCGRRDAD